MNITTNFTISLPEFDVDILVTSFSVGVVNNIYEFEIDVIVS